MSAYPGSLQVRGPGLMVGTVFDDAARVPRVIEHCLDEGHLILMNAGTYGNVIRWMPPLVVTAERDRRRRAGVRATPSRPRPEAGRSGHASTRRRAGACVARPAVDRARDRTPHRRRPARRVGGAAWLVRRAGRAAPARRSRPPAGRRHRRCGSRPRASAAGSTGSRRRAGCAAIATSTPTTTARSRSSSRKRGRPCGAR